jgi:hypothetical protein
MTAKVAGKIAEQMAFEWPGNSLNVPRKEFCLGSLKTFEVLKAEGKSMQAWCLHFLIKPTGPGVRREF